jgi:hypothetical protein
VSEAQVEKNPQADKLEALARRVEHLCELIQEIHDIRETSPGGALGRARVTAEQICQSIYLDHVEELGPPHHRNGYPFMLHEYKEKLWERGLIPKHIKESIELIKNRGNRGAHVDPEGHTEVSKLQVHSQLIACWGALTELTSWYFTDYLKKDIPDPIGPILFRELKRLRKPARAWWRSRKGAALFGAGLCLVAIFAVALFRGPGTSFRTATGIDARISGMAEADRYAGTLRNLMKNRFPDAIPVPLPPEGFDGLLAGRPEGFPRERNLDRMVLLDVRVSFRTGNVVDARLVSAELVADVSMLDPRAERVGGDALRVVGAGFSEAAALDSGFDKLLDMISQKEIL